MRSTCVGAKVCNQQTDQSGGLQTTPSLLSDCRGTDGSEALWGGRSAPNKGSSVALRHEGANWGASVRHECSIDERISRARQNRRETPNGSIGVTRQDHTLTGEARPASQMP